MKSILGRNIKWIAAAGLLLALPLPTHASTMYSYSGNQFQVCNGVYSDCTTHSISGNFTTTLSGASLNGLDYYQISGSELGSFSFSNDMGLVLTNNNSTNVDILISTDGAGQILNWVVGFYIRLFDSNNQFAGYASYIETLNRPQFTQVVDYTRICEDRPECLGEIQVRGFAYNQGLAGSWTSSVAPVPIPAALPLLAAGLGAMGFMGWRKKRKVVVVG